MGAYYGEHKVPEPFQDEDKWFWLTKRQLLILIPVIVLCIGIIVVTFKWHILPIGIILSVILLILAIGVMVAKMPPEKYLFGSGLRMETLALRLLRKQLPSNKKVYTRFYENGHREW